MAKKKTPELSPDFKAAFDNWMFKAQALVNQYWSDNKYTHAQSPLLQSRIGGRFMIVTAHDRANDGTVAESGRAFAFVDITGGPILGLDHAAGSVLKPASFRQPAKIARGNIFDEKNGMGTMTAQGPGYLR
jgi:hypothetical protein